MHELSIAMSILEVVEEEADHRGGVRVFGIHLKMGPLAGVVKEALLSSFDLARECTTLADVELLIEDAPLRVFCPTCRAERGAISTQQMCCDVCGTPTPEVVSGRELEIVALEIE